MSEFTVSMSLEPITYTVNFQEARSATIQVGTITTGAAGSSASVTNVGTANAAIFDITIPRGNTGATGLTGPAGTITVGTVTTGAAGSSVVIENVGTASAAVLNITIPRGNTGAAGAPGSDANVTNANVNAAISVNSGATRTALGLGTMAIQQANAVAITGGSAAFTANSSVTGYFTAQLAGSATGKVLLGAITGIGRDFPGIWFGSATAAPTTTNYGFLFDSTSGTILNTPAGLSLFLRVGNTNAMMVDPSGNVGMGTLTPTCQLDINANTMRLRTARTPASATATGNQGDICWDANYIYTCVATNTWKRSPLSTW